MATVLRKTLLEQLYIIAIDTPDVERLPIQYTPETIAYNRAATVTDVVIVGRNDNLHHYVGGSTTLTLDLTFYSQVADRMDVKKKIKWLESQTYSDGERPPSRLKIVFGELFKDEIWILTGCNVAYSVFEPGSGFLPLYATASLSFVRDTVVDLQASDIRNMNY